MAGNSRSQVDTLCRDLIVLGDVVKKDEKRVVVAQLSLTFVYADYLTSKSHEIYVAKLHRTAISILEAQEQTIQVNVVVYQDFLSPNVRDG